jgi:dihydrofolate synthase/folylpolyglutamate synthase
LKVALFTSPHLRDFRERIRINGTMVPKSYVTQFVKKYQQSFDDIEPSFFEWTFALAMSYFGEQKPDIAVVETGMGGRLDSTNIIKPVLSIITNIGWDHMTFLGDTLEKIAGEKAGIIKQGIPVVIGETQSQTEAVFTNMAQEQTADIMFADQRYDVNHFIFKMSPSPLLSMDLSRDQDLYIEKLQTPLAGLYQLKNTLTVLQSIEVLQRLGFEINETQVREGFKNVIRNTGLKGRWQVLKRKPLTLCDTGHNLNGLQEVVRQLRFMPHENLHFVLGMVADKDLDHILDILPRKARYYFCRPDIPRGLDVAILAEKAASFNLEGQSFPTVAKAVEAAQQAAGEKDLVFVGGSTFVVAEVV